MKTLDTTQVWNDFSGELHQYIIKKVQNKEVAKDISQELFIKLHQHLSSLKDEQKVTAWLFRIAHHQIIDYYRQHQKASHKPSIVMAKVTSTDHKDETKALASCMHRMIAELPPKYREAVQLADIEGLSQKELAEHLGISYSGAKSRVQRGRLALKNIFLQCCAIEHDKYGNIIHFKANCQENRTCE